MVINVSVVVMFVCCHPIYSGLQACGGTSRGPTGGRSHRISPPSFGVACRNFSREKDSAVPFPTVKSNFVNRSPLVGHFLLFIYLLIS